MRILLTGGAGYVGSACLRWLLAHGHDAIAYDNLSEGNEQAVPQGRLYVGDILNTTELTGVMARHRTEVVIHLAAVASVPESISDPERYYRINVLGTKSVLDAMRAAGVPGIVFSSTAATYGLQKEMPLKEDAPQTPAVPYGSTKLAAEWLIREYGAAYGIGYVFMRYFNASGADANGQHGEARRRETHLIPLVLQAALGQRPEFVLYGDDWPTVDGTCVRDFIHVEDLAEAHRLAALALHPGRQSAYNLGSGRGHTIREVLRACEEVTGRRVPVRVAGRRPGDPAVLIASSAKIQNELGWKPRYTDIRSIVETAYRWHRDHPHGYARTRQLLRPLTQSGSLVTHPLVDLAVL